MPDQPNPPELLWCHGCGDHVDLLGDDELCLHCLEVDARMDAEVASALEEYVDHALSVALDYLHRDDVRAIIDRLVRARRRQPEVMLRLKERYERAHTFIDLRRYRAHRRTEQYYRDRRQAPPGTT